MMNNKGLDSLPWVSDIKNLPHINGVYIVKSLSQVLYIGCTHDLYLRFKSSHNKKHLFKLFNSIKIFYTEHGNEELENRLIVEHQPLYNFYNNPIYNLRKDECAKRAKDSERYIRLDHRNSPKRTVRSLFNRFDSLTSTLVYSWMKLSSPAAFRTILSKHERDFTPKQFTDFLLCFRTWRRGNPIFIRKLSPSMIGLCVKEVGNQHCLEEFIRTSPRRKFCDQHSEYYK